MENLVEKYDFEDLEPFTDSEFKEVYKDAVKIMEFAEANSVNDSSVLDMEYDIPASDFFDMIDMRLLNTNINPKKPDMTDLSPALILIEMLIHTFPLDINYSSFVTAKATLLFKMGKPDMAEEWMLSYIKKNPTDSNSYLELSVDFEGIMHDTKKAIEYLKMGLSVEGIDDREALEDNLADFGE